MPRVLPSEVVKTIDLFYPSQSSKSDSFEIDFVNALQMGSILDLIDRIPPELINLEGEEYIFYLSSLSALRAALSKLQSTGGSVRLIKLKGFGNMNPLSSLRNLLEKLPDQFPSLSTPGLLFISDMDLRDELRMDISIANQALSNEEWKPATIIAGSAVEALLLWSLQQPQITKLQIKNAISNALSKKLINKDPGQDIENWTLHPLIEVAGDLKIIKNNTVNQCRLARDFRNLIHPGKGIRLGQKCNRATALTAIAALEHVINDLTT
jgi:hypothetical protein